MSNLCARVMSIWITIAPVWSRGINSFKISFSTYLKLSSMCPICGQFGTNFEYLLCCLLGIISAGQNKPMQFNICCGF